MSASKFPQALIVWLVCELSSPSALAPQAPAQERAKSDANKISVEKLIEEFDQNDDGYVSRQEASELNEIRFAELDADQDGLLSQSELRRASRTRRQASGGAQRNDPAFRPRDKESHFDDENAPRVAIDEGHRNFHTKDGRFLPFAEVLRGVGCRVIRHGGAFTADSLNELDLLVIANALSSEFDGPDIGSAFTEIEIKFLVDWVRQGGRLMLLADHHPYGESAAALAKAFGIEMSGGYVLDRDEDRGRIVFSRDNRQLAVHPITAGLDGEDPIESVTSFTGQALRFPDNFTPLMSLAQGTVCYADRKAIAADRDPTDVTGWHQGGVGQVGRGRVAIFGEAGMFSAQISVSGRPMGMNAAGAEQNQDFLINVVRWLADGLEDNS